MLAAAGRTGKRAQSEAGGHDGEQQRKQIRAQQWSTAGTVENCGSIGLRRANASMTERSARQLTETAVEVFGRVMWQSMGSAGASGANVDRVSI